MDRDELVAVMLYQIGAFNRTGATVNEQTIHRDVLPDEGPGNATPRRIYKAFVRSTFSLNGVESPSWPPNWPELSVSALADRLLSSVAGRGGLKHEQVRSARAAHGPLSDGPRRRHRIACAGPRSGPFGRHGADGCGEGGHPPRRRVCSADRRDLPGQHPEHERVRGRSVHHRRLQPLGVSRDR